MIGDKKAQKSVVEWMAIIILSILLFAGMIFMLRKKFGMFAP